MKRILCLMLILIAGCSGVPVSKHENKIEGTLVQSAPEINSECMDEAGMQYNAFYCYFSENLDTCAKSFERWKTRCGIDIAYIGWEYIPSTEKRGYFVPDCFVRDACNDTVSKNNNTCEPYYIGDGGFGKQCYSILLDGMYRKIPCEDIDKYEIQRFIGGGDEGWIEISHWFEDPDDVCTLEAGKVFSDGEYWDFYIDEFVPCNLSVELRKGYILDYYVQPSFYEKLAEVKKE